MSPEIIKMETYMPHASGYQSIKASKQTFNAIDN